MRQPKEIWKDVVGFEGQYQVSNFGRVMSLERTTLRKNGYPLPIRCRILKYRKNEHGYLSVHYYRNHNQEVTAKVHRLVAIAFVPNPRGLKYINHKDNNPANNKASNLEWCSSRENASHGHLILGKKQSKFIGVSRSRNGKRWMAFIYVKKNINLGTFDTELEASLAYKKALKKYKLSNRYS